MIWVILFTSWKSKHWFLTKTTLLTKLIFTYAFFPGGRLPGTLPCRRAAVILFGTTYSLFVASLIQKGRSPIHNLGTRWMGVFITTPQKKIQFHLIKLSNLKLIKIYWKRKRNVLDFWKSVFNNCRSIDHEILKVRFLMELLNRTTKMASPWRVKSEVPK